MTHMFDSFYNIPYGYIPDNMHPKIFCPPKPIQVTSDNLDRILDKNGEFKGYSWNYGETIQIPLTVNFNITIESNAYYTYNKEEEPNIHTPGMIGQKFYNLSSVKSWVLKSYIPSEKYFMWELDPLFTYPSNGPVIIQVKPDMEDKYILAEFLNFRGEQIFENIYPKMNNGIFNLTVEESLTIPRGIYTLAIYVGSDTYKQKTETYEIVVR